MDEEQLPGEETTAPEVPTPTQSIGSAWKRKRSRSDRMAALASKRWDRGDAQASSSIGTHAEILTPPGPKLYRQVLQLGITIIHCQHSWRILHAAM